MGPLGEGTVSQDRGKMQYREASESRSCAIFCNGNVYLQDCSDPVLNKDTHTELSQRAVALALKRTFNARFCE